MKKGMHDEAIAALEEAAFHAKEFDAIEAKSLRKLRHPSRSRKLKDFLTD